MNRVTEVEEKGRQLLVRMIGLLILYEVLTFLMEPLIDIALFIGIALQVTLWAMIYKGHLWAKIVTILLLGASTIVAILFIVFYPGTMMDFIWWIITIVLYVSVILVLLISTAIKEYMDAKIEY